jgi:hypothetical protein
MDWTTETIWNAPAPRVFYFSWWRIAPWYEDESTIIFEAVYLRKDGWKAWN